MTQPEGFIRKNIDIAAYYRNYTSSRRQVLNVIESKNQEMVRARNEEQIVKARENHKFHLIYWDVMKELREEKIDQFVKLVRRQKFKKMHLAFLTIQKVVRIYWDRIDHEVKEE